MSGNIPVTVSTYVGEFSGVNEKPSGNRAISVVTFLGLKRSARAAACSAIDSPPHMLLNDNAEAMERL
jgi:hypothetical protein